MVKIHAQKELRTKIDALIEAHKNRTSYIEPLQEKALQVSLDVVVSHIEVTNFGGKRGKE